MSKAKRVHGLLECLVFVGIFLVCFILVMQTSMQHQIISREGACSRGHANGLLYYIMDKELSDLESFANGVEELNQRMFEHILKPRVSGDFVVSPALFSITLAFLALGGPENDISEEIINAASLPCDVDILKQDLIIISNKVTITENGFKNSRNLYFKIFSFRANMKHQLLLTWTTIPIYFWSER